MFAKSVWVNDENISREVNVVISKRGIYVNGEYMKEKSRVCIFTQLKQLKELEHKEITCVTLNRIVIRGCKYIELDDTCVNFLGNFHDIVAYVQISDVKELAIQTSNGIMFIADEQ